MYRAMFRIITLCCLIVLASVAAWTYHHYTSQSRQVEQLLEEKKQLEQAVTRLTSDKRVADVLVLDQKEVDGRTITDLLFVEYNRAGEPLPARTFQIEGTIAHIEAMVIEFKPELVIANDPLRGHSIALFTRIFGESQTPASASRIDSPGKMPEFFRGTDENITQFETNLWQKFWNLESDENLRKEMGVHLATGKGVWGPFEKGKLYTITLEPTGNLSRTVEPMRGVYETYIDMMRKKLQGA